MKNNFNFRLIFVLRTLMAALTFSLTLVSNSFALDLYVAENGRDSNDGTSISRAVATISHAVELAVLDHASSNEPVRVVVLPGTYKGQSVVIDGGLLKGSLTIIGQSKNPVDFPVFAGNGNDQTWLTLKSSNGRLTGLTIQALQIRDYFTAISLEGNRDVPHAYNSGTTIRRNIFRNIGSIASTHGDTGSTAAVRFVNSRDNLVELNQFHTIRNKKACGGLHALYLAHFSSGNRIINNSFDDACGSVVKLRDRSNDNIIENNRFTNIEKAPAVEEWFCDMNARKDCTKKLGECPSTGNVQRENSLSSSAQSEMISIVGNREQRAWCSANDFTRERVNTR